MARRQEIALGPSLFPFMSILICLMGVLAFVMVATALVSTLNPGVIPVPEGDDQRSKTPTFVECHGSRLVLSRDRIEVPLSQIAAPGAPFRTMIADVARQPDKRYILIFVYPDGIECLERARNVVEAAKVGIGYEPVLPGWRLRFRN